MVCAAAPVAAGGECTGYVDGTATVAALAAAVVVVVAVVQVGACALPAARSRRRLLDRVSCVQEVFPVGGSPSGGDTHDVTAGD